MDPSSIITQVKKEDVKKAENGQKGKKQQTPRGSRPRKIFQSFLCCVSKRSGQSRSRTPSPAPPTATVDGTQQQRLPSLLPAVKHQDMGKICLIVDLDETLVHSSFKPIANADFIVPVEIDDVVHQVYVLKRPHVDEFLKRIGELFECILFTASLSKYADPVADLLDRSGVFRSRLFREACVFYRGNYVKDLERLGRDVNRVVIVDNSPASYIFHPENAVACKSWFDDMTDTELLDRLPLFDSLASATDIYPILAYERSRVANSDCSTTPTPQAQLA